MSACKAKTPKEFVVFANVVMCEKCKLFFGNILLVWLSSPYLCIVISQPKGNAKIDTIYFIIFMH